MMTCDVDKVSRGQICVCDAKSLNSLFKTVENTERDEWERTRAILHYGKLSWLHGFEADKPETGREV